MGALTTSSLYSPRVSAVLQRLFKAAAETDPKIQARIRAESPGGVRNDARAQELLSDAYIPVSPEAGRLLYILVRATASMNIVEFGASFGISTIHLAAAVRDNGSGHIISSEMHPEKVRQARKNLSDAGLNQYVEIREGNALQTLAHLDKPIDCLFLDGWKELYLPLLKLLEPRLRNGTLIIADDLNIFPEVMKPYLEYVRKPENGYTSEEIPVGDGMEISLRTA